MQSQHSDMQAANESLERVIARSLRKAPAGEGPLLAWSLVCGSAVAARTRAIEFRDGVVRVEVPDTGWRRELQALAPRYVAQINRYVADKVQRIEFVVANGGRASR
jgi:predicted nucleic acid-binding Zn ribbon protein